MEWCVLCWDTERQIESEPVLNSTGFFSWVSVLVQLVLNILGLLII